ncbi:MAG: acyltransferase domain-containing protein [Planctomycetota bacterium]|nr:acyltransferase domain-containing protein [Planctomycetota bacterium]
MAERMGGGGAAGAGGAESRDDRTGASGRAGSGAAGRPAASADTADADRVFEAAGIRDGSEPLRERWDEAQAAFSPDRLAFLEPRLLLDSCRAIGIGRDIEEPLLGAAATIRGSAALSRLAWYGRWRLFEADGGPRRVVRKAWPVPPDSAGPFAGLFWAVVFLSGVPDVFRANRARSIPDDITADTLADIEVWIRENTRRDGRWSFRQLAWANWYFACELYKLGRLQFNFETFRLDMHALRNRRDGRLVVLAGDGMLFRDDGRFHDADRRVEERPWRASFSAGGGAFRGHPISPLGAAEKEAVELAADEWEEVLRMGDPVLGTHIQAGRPMSFEECMESYARALEFFPRHFPERPFRAFACSSWLLDPRYRELLPPSSNIVRFQKELYLLPLPGAHDGETFNRVFGGPVRDLDSAPRDTSLRRAILDFYRAGGRLRDTGSLLFPEHIGTGGRMYGIGGSG